MIGNIEKGKCSECHEENVDVLDVHGVWYCSKCYKENSNHLSYRHKMNEKDKMMQKARIIVHKMVKEGSLFPEKCIVCGKLPTEAHHEDYNKPLNVKWVCKKHHKEIHNRTE